MNYKELAVWQRAMQLAVDVYALTSELPDSERFGLVSQLRRAAVSIASNIAEGKGRATDGEFRQFLCHARGSLYEVETQVLLCRELGYLNAERIRGIETSVGELGRMINGLLRSLG